jgi:opacity protein-like surface antigen
MQRLVLSVLLVVFIAPCASSQKQAASSTFPRLEFYAGYLDSGEAQYNVFQFTQPGSRAILTDDFGTKTGVEFSATRNWNRRLGIKADFSAHFHHDEGPVNLQPCQGCVVTQSATITPHLYNFLVGPEFKFRNHTRVTPFAHALVGAAHTSTRFTTSGTGANAVNLDMHTSETGFAMGLGPGLDVRLTRRISYRTVVDYNPKWVGRDDNLQRSMLGDVRLTVGIVLH